MREIKFRAWDRVENKFIYLPDPIKMYCDLRSGDDWYDPERCYDPKDFILMRYTGLKDKMGREIYEEDIVKVHTPEGERVGLVEYTEGCFVVSFGDYDECVALCWLGDDVEVIGNFYQNPELLER